MPRPDRRRVSHEDEHEPRGRRSRDEDDRPRRRKRRKGSPLPWILGVGGGLVVLVAVFVVVLNSGGPAVNNNDLPRGDKPPGDKPPTDRTPASIAWRYVPDAATPKALTDAKMPVAEDPHRVMDIAFSTSGAAQAVVAYEGEKGNDAAVPSLHNCGLKYAAAGDLTLTINAKEMVSGKFLTYVSPGVGSENAAHRTIEIRATLTDSMGRALFYSETAIQPPSTLTFQRGQASKELEGAVHASARAWVSNLSIPPTKHFINGELVDLPLTVPFSEKGHAPKG